MPDELAINILPCEEKMVMMMKSKKTNKKLALLVGMAMSAGVAFSFAPGDAYAADYTFTYNGGWEADATQAKIAEAIKAGGNTVTFNYSSWKQYLTETKDVESGEFSVGAGNTIVVNGDTGTTQASYKVVVGSDGGALTAKEVDGKLVLNADKVDTMIFDIESGEKRLMRMTGEIGTVIINGNGYAGEDTGTDYIKFASVNGEELKINRVEVSNGAFLKTQEGSNVKIGTLVLNDGARIGKDGVNQNLTSLSVDNLVIDASDANLSKELENLTVAGTVTGAGEVNVEFVNGIPDESLLTAVANATGADVEEVKQAAVENVVANTAGGNPFEVKLPSASDIANNEYMTPEQKAKVIAAVQEAGKTAAAPGVTSARAATAITNVLTNNVVTRTAEIRDFASAVDEGRPSPDKMWFQYKHTNMDVDGGDTYSKSTINTNNFQLGYDTQIGTNDYLGAYIGTTTGNADFNGPAQSGRIDIENSFDFGVYGTHMLPNDQYIDYMIHTGKFDSKLNDGVKYGTNDTGAMVGYGAKIAQNDRLTLNPYIQLAYDKISVDSYYAGPNYIKSDDSNNWTAKLGLNLIDASGLYGGIAYSRGLSGSYNAYINGVSMPTNDYNANVLYLSLGYRASMAKNAVLDLSMEKTFMDYKGWTAAGKVNFYF